MKKWNMRTSLSSRIATIAFAMIIICAVIIGVLSFVLYRNNAIDSSGLQALGIVQSVSAAIDKEPYEQLATTEEKNEYWTTLRAYLDQVKTDTEAAYLYALADVGGGNVKYVAEGKNPQEEETDVGFFGEVEPEGVFADETYETLSTGESTVTDIYDSEGFGMMVSAFAPVTNADGAIIGVVGIDLSVDDVLRSSNIFGIIIIVIIAGVSILSGVITTRFMEKNVGKPINEVERASRQIAKGDMDITINFHSEDELGRLINSFKEMVDSTVHQAEVLETIADGDLTVEPVMRSEKDTMSGAMIKMVKSLREVVGRISKGTEQVSTSSQQIADGANLLAQGSIEQTTVVQQLSVAIDNVTQKTGQNAKMAAEAKALATQIGANAGEGTEKMEQLIQAVQQINDASDAINKIIKVIDDIAFQTNILALNAAVEAARAGEHGKGFAVVADEVRNLAAKSAEAAKETGNLITNTIERAEEGAKMAQVTSESLNEIISGIHQSNEIISEIATVSEEQNVEIEQINKGIDNVAEVVQQNSATAEQSAAASQEMNGQSQMLNDLVSRFKVE